MTSPLRHGSGRRPSTSAGSRPAAGAAQGRGRRITLGEISNSRLSSASVFSPLTIRWTVVRLNSVLKTRRPSAFHGCSPMAPPAASYGPAVSGRNGEHSQGDKRCFSAPGEGKSSRRSWNRRNTKKKRQRRSLSRVLVPLWGDDHFSRAPVARRLERLDPGAGRAIPLLPYSALLRVGFTEPKRSPAPLVSSYLTVSPLPQAFRPRRFAFCGTVRGVAPPGR